MPCQAASPAGVVTLAGAQALYEQARFADAAAAFSALARRDADQRLVALAGQERALKAQACDQEAIAVQQQRLAWAEAQGDVAAQRQSLARLARLSTTRDSAQAQGLAERALVGQPASGDDTAADAHTTLAILAIGRSALGIAHQALQAALAAATSPLRRAEAWRAIGALRQSDRQYGAPQAAWQQGLDEALAARDPEAIALARIALAAEMPVGPDRQAAFQTVRGEALRSNMRRVEALADQQEAEGLRQGASYAGLMAATELLARATQRYAETGDLAQERLVQLQLATLRYTIGDMAGSRTAVQRSAELASWLQQPIEVAKAWHQLGLLAMAQEPPDLDAADQHLRRAQEALASGTDGSALAGVTHDRAMIALLRGQAASAVDTLLQTQAQLAGSQEPRAGPLRQQLLVSLGWALMQDGRPDDAMAPLLAASAQATGETLGRAWWGLARLQRASSPELALRYYERALAEIDPLRPRGRNLPTEARPGFDRRFSSLYRELATLLLSLGQPARAHYVALLMQRMTLIEADWPPSRDSASLPEGLRPAVPPAACEKAAAQSGQSYLDRWRALAAAPAALRQCCSEARDASTCPQPRDQALRVCEAATAIGIERVSLQREITTCLAGLQGQKHDTEAFLDARFDDQWTKAMLSDDGPAVTRVVTLLDVDRLHVLVRSPQAPAYLVRTRSVGRAQVEDLLARWQVARDRAPRASAADIRVLRDGLLREMYQLLFDDLPLATLAPKSADGPSVLALALDGPLKSLPLAALFDGEHYLGEQVSLALLTTDSVVSGGFKPAPLERSLVMGMSDRAAPRLPQVAVEVEAVATRLHTQAFLDEAAVPARVLGWLSGLGGPDRPKERAAVLHIAAHASSGGTPASTVLHLAGKDLSAQELSDRREQLARVQLVVLSACESAAGSQGQVGLGLSGLTEAGGARTVVGSLWRVDDRATAALMAAFYDAWTSADRASVAAALAEAQRLTRKAYPHPYYWAAFTVIGRWD